MTEDRGQRTEDRIINYENIFTIIPQALYPSPINRQLAPRNPNPDHAPCNPYPHPSPRKPNTDRRTPFSFQHTTMRL